MRYATTTAEGGKSLERAFPALHEEAAERFAAHLDEEEIRPPRQAMREVVRASGEEPLSSDPGVAVGQNHSCTEAPWRTRRMFEPLQEK